MNTNLNDMKKKTILYHQEGSKI